MVLTYDEYKKKKKKEIEERNKKEYEKNSVSVGANKISSSDIAPIKQPTTKSTKSNDRTWFSSGAFSDGYQFGDVTKTLLGTASDIKENLYAGALGIGEKTIDAGAYILGGGAKLFGNDNFANKTQKFIEKDLINEEKIAKGINTTTTHGMLNQFLNKGNTDEASLFGEKTDSLVQSGGQLAGTIGLQAVGVPWWLTTGTTSFGAETEQAFKQGATYGEAGFSGLVTAGAEILTEKISGGIKFGGRTLDDGLQNIISEKITNKALQKLAKITVGATGEGLEEVLSEGLSTLGQQLSYEREETWNELLSDETKMEQYIDQVLNNLFGEEARANYGEAFIGGAVLGGAGSTIQMISDKGNASKTEDNEDIAPVKEQDDLPDSKVRDKDGKLITVYHGTRADFDTYDTSKAGQNYQNNWSNNGKGVYFTDDKAEAMEYAKSSIDEGSPKVKEAQLDITNPFDSSKDYTKELSGMAQEYGIEPYYLERGDRLFNWFNTNKKDVVEALSKYGYDGIVDHGHYTVFDPKQVKSIENKNATVKESLTVQNEQDIARDIIPVKENNDYQSYLQKQEETLNNTKEALGEEAYNSLKSAIETEKESVKGKILETTKSKPADNVNDSFFKEHISEYDYNQGKKTADGKVNVLRLQKGDNLAKLTFTEGQDVIWIDELYVKNQKQGYGSEIVKALKKYAEDNGKYVKAFKELSTAKGFWDKTLRNDKDIQYDLAPVKETVEDNNIDQDIQDKINSSMTMEEAKKMIQIAFQENKINDWREANEKYANGDEWLNDVGIDEVATYIDNTESTIINYTNPLYDKNIGFGEDYYTESILEAYQNGTLKGSSKEQASRLDLSKDTNFKDDRFYAPRDIKGDKNLYEIASQRVTNSNRAEVYKARADFIINAHNKGYIESLGLTQDEVNKKLKSWANYTKKAMDLSNSFNEGVPLQNRWTGIENSSIVNTISISNEEMGKLVKDIKGDSNGWQRSYITSAMLALDTHIDYSKLTFEFDQHQALREQGALGDYNRRTKTIRIGSGHQNTVAHEIGHYIDNKWAEDFGFLETYNLTDNLNFDVIKTTDEVKQFNKNFQTFMNDIIKSATVGYGEKTNYYQSRSETFARFVARFIEWTKNQATNNRYGYEDKYYNDNFTERQYREFVKILQEKALLDTTGQTYTPVQEKNIDNTSPTSNADIRYSLDEDIAPVDEDVLPENKEQKQITKEWTDKVNKQNEVNTPLAKEQAKATGHNTMVGYSPILSNYKLYSNGSLSWVTPEGKLNSKVIAETEIDSFLSKNKIDRLAGGINTFENGLSNQLSTQNDIAPIKQELTDLTNELKSAIKETKKELKTLTKQVNEVIEENKALAETDIPMVEAQASENLDTLTDNDIAPVQEDTTPEYESNSTTIESPFDSKDMKEVGSQKVKAYQFENPEVKPFFKTEAEAMLGELENTVKGARLPIYDEVGNMDYVGVTRETTEAIAYLKDNYNYTYAEIEKGLNAIIEDDGKENIAVAKRIEFMLDDRLRNGYTSIDGTPIPPNQDYIDLLHEKGFTEYNQEVSQGLTDELAPVEDVEAPVESVEKPIENASETQQVEEIVPTKETNLERYLRLKREYDTNKDFSKRDELLSKLNALEDKLSPQELQEVFKLESNQLNVDTTDIAPVMEQTPTLKEVSKTEDPVMNAVKNQVRRELEKTIGERRNELIRDDKYANNNIVIKQKPTLKESVSRTWDALQSHHVNRNHQIDKLSKATGNKEIKFKGDRVNNIAGEIGGDIFTAQTDNYGNVIGKSLDAPFESARNEGLDTYFDNYLKHQSNIERHAQGKGSAKVSAEASKKYVKAYESKYPQFKDWAKDVYTYNQNLLDNAVQNGLIDEYFKNTLTTMYGKYVPFYEQNAEPSEYMTPEEIKASKPIKRARGGSDTNLLGIEQAMIQQTYAYKNAIAKNDLYKEIGSVMGKKVELGADVRTSPTQLDSTLYADENGKYLSYYDNGQQKTVQITNELYTELSRDLEHQIRNLEEKYSLITKPLQKISQIRGQILTTYNPGFIITNPFKDVKDALHNTKYLGKYVKNVLNASSFSDSIKGTKVSEYAKEFKELTGKDITTVRDAKTLKGKARAIYKDYQAGTMWNRFITSYGTNATSMEFGDTGVEVKKKNRGFLNGIEKFNNYSEVIFRYPEFKATLERGGSFTEALYNAREVTTNFGRGGTVSKAINRNGATFYNTSIQGMDKFIRNFTEDGARGFVRASSRAVLLGMAPAILNHLLFGDDDEEYEALPDYIKDNYYLFKTGYGEFIRIPKGRMEAVFGSTARRTLELASGEKDAFEGYLKNASDQIGASNPLKENVFSPLIQAYGSENGEAWYGGDLVPTRLQNKPKAEQYDEGTDEFSKWLGEQLNISPYKINYVIDQYSGGIGDIVLPMITDEAKSDGTLLAPLKDKFTANSTDDNKYVGELYDLSEEFTVKANGENASEEDILKNKYLNSIKSQMSELYKEKREIQSSDLPKETKYERVKVIQNMINALAKEGLDFHTAIEVTDNYANVGYYEEYYKTSEGEWYSINDDELEEINLMGMTTEEKNSYFGAKNNIHTIKDEYEDLLNEVTEDEKDNLYTEQKRAIIDEVRNTNLTDEEKAYLYDRYYGSTDKLNVIIESSIPFDAYLDLEYQDFKADKDKYGKSISGSKKKKIMNFIESTGLDYNHKIILHKVYYPADDKYNYEIADYVFNNIETYETRIIVLEALGFTIDENGVVHWN